MQWGESLWEIINRSPSITIGSTIIIISSWQKNKKKKRHSFQSYIIFCFILKQWGAKTRSNQIKSHYLELTQHPLSYLYIHWRAQRQNKKTLPKGKIEIKKKLNYLLQWNKLLLLLSSACLDQPCGFNRTTLTEFDENFNLELLQNHDAFLISNMHSSHDIITRNNRKLYFDFVIFLLIIIILKNKH